MTYPIAKWFMTLCLEVLSAGHDHIECSRLSLGQSMWEQVLLCQTTLGRLLFSGSQSILPPASTRQ
jgi:hypothetical protein